MLRSAEPKDFVGKTVSRIENVAFNTLKLHFSDGTSVELWAETNALCGGLNLPGIFVFDEKNVK